jgi:hypothetical protein
MERLGENDQFTFYAVVSDTYPDISMILKVVTDKVHNGILEREAFLLNEMSEEAERIDAEYAATNDGKILNYQMGFPKLVEQFISPEHQDRRILILRLTMSDLLSNIVPINMVREIDNVRVDPKTSVWILGKLLKILAFAHDMARATIGNFELENIFIFKEHHLVTVFDWSKAVIYSSAVPQKTAMDELRQATKAILILLGGDPEIGTIPQHEHLEGEGAQYRELLQSFLTGDFESIYDAHAHFYEVVKKIWGRQYYPYTTLPIEN